MDILREITEEELSFFTAKIEEHMLYTIKDVYFIMGAKIFHKKKRHFADISERLLPTFYTHREGLKENCTIFGITSEQDHLVWFYSLEQSCKELKECLEQSKLIKWEPRLLFLTLHKEYSEIVLNCISKNNYKLQSNEPASYYWLPKQEAAQFQIKVPEGTYMRKLKEEESSICNNIWEHKSERSENVIRSLILISGGWALYDNISDELLSFALINEHLATGMLTSVEHARGKGYGGFISKVLALKIVESFDIHPICFINSLNFKSMKLFEKLGYRKISDSNWIAVGQQKY